MAYRWCYEVEENKEKHLVLSAAERSLLRMAASSVDKRYDLCHIK